MNIIWDTDDYTKNFDFVYKYGEDIIKLIDAEKGSFVVDLGCGNGALSEKILKKGYRVLGIDASENMIKKAKKFYPSMDFKIDDALSFNLSEKADVIFSNAMIHWIDEENQEVFIKNLSNQMRLGGQFICEFGGKDCAETIHFALENNFAKRGFCYPRTFYFPTIGEYAPILEKFGLRVEYASLFQRPTEQKGEYGLENWINMFLKKPFEDMERDVRNDIIRNTVSELKSSKLYVENKWFIDYVRIRIKAKKVF